MTYVVATRQLDLNNRPAFITTDPVTMTSGFAMLHHRISWNALGGAINAVLAGAAQPQVINYLLRMSPGNSFAVINGFTTALNRVLANQTLTQPQIDAIEMVEQLIFTLPCNLFQGLNARADDPGNGIDFLPGDVTVTGTLPRVNNVLTPLGVMQQLREKLMNRLLNLGQPGALIDIGVCCAGIAQQWAVLTPAAAAVAAAPPAPAIPARTSLQQATGFNGALWAPGAAPWANPGYRNWPGPLTAAQSLALNTTVMNRVNNGY